MATYKARVLDGFDWWCDELRAVWSSFAPNARQPKPSDSTITLADDGIRAHAVGGPEFQSPPLPLDATLDEIATLLRAGRRHPSVAIRIDSALILKRQLGGRRLPVRQARDMAELDLMASTPIDPSQVHIVFTDGAGDGSFYLVVKKKALAAALDAIRAVGGNLASLIIADAGQTLRPDPLSLAAIWPARTRDRFARRAWVAAFAIVLLGLAATYGHAQWRSWQAGGVLDDEIATAQVEARKARASLQKRQAELEQTEKLRTEKKNAVSVVRILAELTRLLPDSAWVSDLSSRGDQLTITGFATSAADLIQPIDASPLFSAPEFSSPVTRVPGQTGERFTITAKVEER
ncbi:PilN domain-containing protein [Mesorhizobium sp. MSK_1335]|uniref:PilN domain-containing protein n=1 Tax=Mesorhizobium montanum TaxID=3072323 RepID=A0ABU4ZKJ4_9HYPH|nr:PilN domain-containing protein [Mesorhizobium sp. MSK_1335]MDX8525885.1 PilN domain-containing protein [Mesorhizobium sp. MSK_1335]